MTPYGELRFEGASLPSVKSFDESGGVFLLGTFSKIFCPGYRLGWVAGGQRGHQKIRPGEAGGGPAEQYDRAQREIMRYLELHDIDTHIARLRRVYKSRRDTTVSVMASEFPDCVSFTRPQGGLFTWAELPEHLDARVLLERSLERKVAFVPGGAFFPNGGHENTMRLNFSSVPENRLTEGLGRLGALIKEVC